MSRLLIVVDMQNDFITGSLANKDAEKIIPNLCSLIEHWDGDIIFTQDTHYDNYLETEEGKNLPIPHCIYETDGWKIHKDLINKAYGCGKIFYVITKPTFGNSEWHRFIGKDLNSCKYDEIYICGTCTDICVISNALILKAIYPNIPITILSNLCAATTSNKQLEALSILNSCQIKTIQYNDGTSLGVGDMVIYNGTPWFVDSFVLGSSDDTGDCSTVILSRMVYVGEPMIYCGNPFVDAGKIVESTASINAIVHLNQISSK